MSDYKDRLRSGEVVERWHWNEGKPTIQYAQDVERILDRNKAKQAAPDTDKTLRHVASIPITVIYQWMTEDGLKAGQFFRWGREEKQRYLRKKLNSSEWQWLKTIPGKL